MTTASMSRRRTTTRRLLGATAVAVVLSTAGATSAWAGDCPGGKGWGGSGGQKPSGYEPGNGSQTGPGQKPTTPIEDCTFSLDGKNFSSSVKVDDASLKPSSDGKVHVWVKAGSPDATCIVSLASYKTHGPTWETSGEQVFWDFDTLGVTGESVDSLDIAVPDVGCFAQVDLYKGATRYDGKEGNGHGPLPVGPSKKVIGDKLIAAWNGGTKDCTTQPSPTPTESAPESSEPTPSASESTPEDTTSTTPGESESESATPSASASTASPVASEGGATPSSQPSAAGGLAETGSSGAGLIAGIATVLLGAGGGVLFMTRRRKAAAARH